MLSFHNDPAIKEKYLSRVIAHRKADNIIQGIGWENGKGCAVGCTLENYDCSRYPIELGLPEWLAKLEDTIFERLPKEDSMLWPEKFLSAIPVGIDAEIVKHKISIKRMNRLLEIQNNLLNKHSENINKVILETISAIELIKKFHEAKINENYCAESAANSAKSALSAALSAWCAAKSALSALSSLSAESADCAAWCAAWCAVQSAVESASWSSDSAALSVSWSADSAAWSAESTALSALSAEFAAKSAAWSAALSAESAESAESAAWFAAWSAPQSAAASASWKEEAEDLLEILSCSMPMN